MILIKKFLLVVLILILILIGISNNKTHKQKSNNWNKITYYKPENLNRYENYKKKNPTKSLEQIVTEVNIGIDIPFYSSIKQANIQNSYYVLVNKYNYLNKNFVPKNLVKIDNTKLDIIAAREFENMRKEAKSENLNIVAISGYRSYEYQDNLYNKYVEHDSKEKADTYSARPGHSEHQTGLAVDISDGKKAYTEFQNTKEFEWMQKNAYKFGFILRYPKEKEYITGYVYESWHYRYVGLEIALYIKKHNITFDEYYVKFIAKN